MNRDRLYVAVMAGGRGERFWPAGRKNRPKQLLPLLGSQTMIEETVQRLFPLFAPERVLVITNRAYVEPIRKLLPIPAENVIGEPAARDTAPGVALAAALIGRRAPDATMVVVPADHVIRPARVLQETLLKAAEAARDGDLVTLGVTPTFPATGYGYIRVGAETAPGFHRAAEFREKPDSATAEEFFRDGDYRWNSGMFVWRVEAIRRAFRQFCPPVADKLDGWLAGADYRTDFEECPKISIDYAIMEKASNVLVGDAPFYWNDLGSWGALRSILPLDRAGNAVCGNVVAIDAPGNVLVTDDSTLLGVIGLRGVAVVKSGNGVLVCPLAEEQRVKELVGKLKELYPEYI